uniref:Unkown protein n=1 Tax=Riptortus pedestris TaxID=329032 RepID=R4WNM2_RIPPE|nr:unkown protein [Riptortus pedestris]
MSNMCGAPKEAEIDDEVKGFLDIALTSHNSESNDEKKVLVKIIKVQKQVVAGLKIIIDFIAESEQSKKQHSCQAVLLSQPWINPQPQIIKFEANPIE